MKPIVDEDSWSIYKPMGENMKPSIRIMEIFKELCMKEPMNPMLEVMGIESNQKRWIAVMQYLDEQSENSNNKH